MTLELYHGSQLAVLMLHGVPKNIFFAHVHSRKYLNKNLSHLGPRHKAGGLAPLSSSPPQRSLWTVRRCVSGQAQDFSQTQILQGNSSPFLPLGLTAESKRHRKHFRTLWSLGVPWEQLSPHLTLLLREHDPHYSAKPFPETPPWCVFVFAVFLAMILP